MKPRVNSVKSYTRRSKGPLAGHRFAARRAAMKIVLAMAQEQAEEETILHLAGQVGREKTIMLLTGLLELRKNGGQRSIPL
jgi:type II secretory pathway predicted ATPase ExeA